MGMSTKQIDIATRRVRMRDAGFCIQLSIMTMAKSKASEAIGTSCIAAGGCIFVLGSLNGVIKPRAVVETFTANVPGVVAVTLTEAGDAAHVAAVGAPEQVIATVALPFPLICKL